MYDQFQETNYYEKNLIQCDSCSDIFDPTTRPNDVKNIKITGMCQACDAAASFGMSGF